jgi:carboxylate-amine ligase
VGRKAPPNIGTIELRVLDSQTSLRSAVALTALTQCLVAKALAEGSRGPYDREITYENKFRASRHGLDAAFYDTKEGRSIPAREVTRNLVDELRPVSQDLSCENELSEVLELVEGGTGSQHQRRVYEESNDFLDVVAYLIENTRPAMAEEQS